MNVVRLLLAGLFTIPLVLIGMLVDSMPDPTELDEAEIMDTHENREF